MITSYQMDAWQFSGLRGHDDPGFQFSGAYDPPKDFEQDRAFELKISGHEFIPPVIAREPITTTLQEKISPPFILIAWSSIVRRSPMVKKEKLGKNLFFATAPTNQLYPSILKAKGLDDYVVVFDAIFPIYFRGIVSSILKVLYRVELDSNPRKQWVPKWDQCFRFDMSAEEILNNYGDQYGSIALLLNRLIANDLPGESVVKKWEQSYKEIALALTMQRDFYAYMFAHELGHIHHGHLENNRFPKSIGLKNDGAAEKEYKADYHAFALLTGAGSKGAQLRTYINISILFHVMSFVHRAIHFLQFQLDYRHLEPSILMRIYFSESTSFYPHPRARLDVLRQRYRAMAEDVPVDLDGWDEKIDSFFEQLWKPVILYLGELDTNISDIWSDIRDMNTEAHKGGNK